MDKVGSMKEGQLKESRGNSKKKTKRNSRDEKILQQKSLSQASVQFSSVAQSCPNLCDPTNHSMPGLPVHHQLLEFTQTHDTQMFTIVMSSSWIEPLIIMQWSSLSLVIFFILQSILSDMRIATPGFFCFPFAWNIFFHPLTFSLYVS